MGCVWPILWEKATVMALPYIWKKCLKNFWQEDEICSACPNNLEQGCEAGRKVQRFDRSVLAYCGFEEGQQLPFREFVDKVQDKILAPGKRTEICGDCQWGSICDQVKSRWE